MKYAVREQVVAQKDVEESIFLLRNCIVMHGTQYLHERKGYDKETAVAVSKSGLLPEAQGSQ